MKNSMKNYDHIKIEKKWQKEWEAKKTYKTLPATKAKKQKSFYVLDMFPYPSGAGLHVGHPRGYIGSDIVARMKRMQGYNVLHPMGYDAFGLPAEQYAIQHKVHPRKAVEVNVKTYEKQLSVIGLSYDWSRKVNTTDPEYYKWTQWIFLQLFNSYYDTQKQKALPIAGLVKLFKTKGNASLSAATNYTKIFTAKEWNSFDALAQQGILMQYRLAYEGESEVNWCKELGTVLANDEIIDGPNGEPVSERGGYPVEKLQINQWFLRITAYADRLLSGLETLPWPEHIKEIQKNWIGKKGNTYNMRDAIFARQRYWGEPIPLYRDKKGIIHEVKKLPLTLPVVKSYEPTGRAEGPLAGVKAWRDKGYEANTMPGWAGSSWYYLRYMDPKNKKALVDKKEVSYWGEVDVYVGGAEHATGHLLYSRFWHKFLKDIAVVKTEEPFLELHNQGLILADDGRKMSKRWGNVINPDEIVKNYGADTLRVYEMFMGPFTDSIAWSTESIIGSRRFIERVWRLGMKVAEQNTKISGVREKKALHKLIKKVTEDIPLFGFNTAVSSMMICLNEWEKESNVNKDDFKKFLQLLAPFAPHMTEELWQELGEKKSIHLSGWPKYDPKLLIEDTVTVVVQVNGKLRGTLSLPKDTTEAQAVLLAKEDKDVARHLDGMEIVKAIFIPNKLLNFVVKN